MKINSLLNDILTVFGSSMGLVILVLSLIAGVSLGLSILLSLAGFSGPALAYVNKKAGLK